MGIDVEITWEYGNRTGFPRDLQQSSERMRAKATLAPSGGDRPASSRRPPDVICHSQTPAPPGAPQEPMPQMPCSIAEIEGDGKGVPVLLRQYLKIGGELLAFNVDKNFSDVLDGLVLVDLRKTDAARLETYMGKEGVARFMEHHSEAATSCWLLAFGSWPPRVHPRFSHRTTAILCNPGGSGNFANPRSFARIRGRGVHGLSRGIHRPTRAQ